MTRADAPSEDVSPPAPAAGGVAAVERALSLIAAIEDAETPPCLADLSRATGLYKSTILRLMETLLAQGYVTRPPDGRYALGPALGRLGLAYERLNPLRAHVLPVMERLVEAGCESPSFHARQGAATRVCLFRLESRHSTLDRVAAGDRLPLDRGAAGKVILAFDGNRSGGNRAGENRAGGNGAGDSGTGESGTGGSGMGESGAGAPPAAELAAIRAQGWALSLGERDPICAGLAAPVFGPGGALIGALSLSGPRDRFGEAEVASMRACLLPAAAELSAALGG